MKIMNAIRPKHYICLYRMGLIIFIKPFEVFDSKKSKSCGFPLRQVFQPPPSPPSRIWLNSQQTGQRNVNGSTLPWESALSNFLDIGKNPGVYWLFI